MRRQRRRRSFHRYTTVVRISCIVRLVMFAGHTIYLHSSQHFKNLGRRKFHKNEAAADIFSATAAICIHCILDWYYMEYANMISFQIGRGRNSFSQLESPARSSQESSRYTCNTLGWYVHGNRRTSGTASCYIFISTPKLKGGQGKSGNNCIVGKECIFG